MALSNVAFCAMSAMIKFIPDIDSYKTSLFRFMIGMAVLGTAAQFGKIQLRFVSGKLLLIRGVCHGISVFFFFLSITKLGLAKGTVISNSWPIFAAVFSTIFLREKIVWWQWLALVVAVFGLYLLFLAKGIGTASMLTIGIYELLAIDDVMIEKISQNAPLHEVREAARAAGMRPLRIDGLEKVKAGITTLEEVYRVTA